MLKVHNLHCFTLGDEYPMGLVTGAMICIHLYRIIQNSFSDGTVLCSPPVHLPTLSLAAPDLTVSIVLPFSECRIIGIIL